MSKIAVVIMATVLLLLRPTLVEAPMLAPMQRETRPLPREIHDPRVEILAGVIESEARGESYTGMVAVGAVIVNRVADPRFPDTVEAVVSQPRQFAPVARSAGAPARRAARAALAGVDPTSGALYFYNPDAASSEWVRTRETVCNIGGHRFAR